MRLRYLDRLLFLEASALTTQFSFGASAGAAYGYQSLARENSIIDGRILVEEKPTISYTPLQGKDFVERVLSRISLETLVLLGGSGWSVDRVYRVCVKKMNDTEHAERADGPTPDTEPEYEAFLRITTLLSKLRDEDMYAGARSPEESSSVLRFQREAGEMTEFQELAQLLDLNPQRRVFSMSNSLDRRDGATLNIRTRSFQGVMYFLANAVRVPEEDIEAGRATVTRDDEGNVFDWSEVMGGLMNSLQRRPTGQHRCRRSLPRSLVLHRRLRSRFQVDIRHAGTDLRAAVRERLGRPAAADSAGGRLSRVAWRAG